MKDLSVAHRVISKKTENLILTLYKGGMNPHQITLHLNENKIPTPSGTGQWWNSGVHRVLSWHEGENGFPPMRKFKRKNKKSRLSPQEALLKALENENAESA